MTSFLMYFSRRPFLSTFLLVPVLMLASCARPAQGLTEEGESDLSDLQAAVVTYFYLPQFTFPEFSPQVFGADIQDVGYDPVSRWVYLSVPKQQDDHLQKALLALCPDTSLLAYARGYEVVDWLGPNPDRDADTSRAILRLPAAAMVLDSTRVIRRKLGRRVVEFSLAELAHSFRYHYAYNAPALALAPGPGNIAYVIANHAAPISKPGDPVLQRLVSQIIPSLLPSREDSAQELLNFVTKAIPYTHHGDLEIFMRPVDVLLAGTSDCSGKVILYGSLLNQVGIPYLLVYLEGHITMGVRGRFPQKNGMFFEHEGHTYTVAETTAEGFVIGRSELIEPMPSWQFKYLQRPGANEKLYDIWKSDSLEFADHVDLSGYRAAALP